MSPLLWLLLPLGAAYLAGASRRPAAASVSYAFFGVPAAGADPQIVADTGAGDPLGITEFFAIMKKTFTLPPAAAPYADAIAAAESRYRLPDTLLGRLLYQESRFRPDIISGATASPAGALGIAQFMPPTARDFGINPLDPVQSIDAAGRYLRQLYDRFGAWDQALAAYNWGQGNHARKDLPDGIVGDDWPGETKRYVRDILGDVDVS